MEIDPEVIPLPVISCDDKWIPAWQVYSPVLASLTMPMIVYLVKLSITELVDKTVTLFGAVHSILTFTSVSTNGLNSTVQVRFGEDPEIIVPIGGVTVTDIGAGTVQKEHNIHTGRTRGGKWSYFN